MKKETKEKIEEYGPKMLAHVEGIVSGIVVSEVIEALAKACMKPTKLSKVLIFISGAAIACTVSAKVYGVSEPSWQAIFEDIKNYKKEICKALKENTKPELKEVTE